MGPRHETRCSHSLPFGVERTADRLLPPELGSPTAPVVPPTGAVPCPEPAVLASGSEPERAPGEDRVARPFLHSRADSAPSSPASGRRRPAGRPTATLSPWWTDQASSSWEPPGGWGRAPSPSRWADAWRQPGLPLSWTSTWTAGGSRSPPVWSTFRAGAGTTCERSAAGYVPTCSSRPCPSTTDATSSRCAAGDHRGHRSARCSTCSGRSRPRGLGWSSTSR